MPSAAACTSPETSPASIKIERRGRSALGMACPGQLRGFFSCSLPVRFQGKILRGAGERWHCPRPPKTSGTPLHYLIDIIRFGSPYLRRYWLALVAGVWFSVVFGLSNGTLVWGTKTILERLSPPAVQHSAGPAGTKLERVTYKVVDPWLPRVGREIDTPQVIGGLLFLPLLVGLRGLSRYLSAW